MNKKLEGNDNASTENNSLRFFIDQALLFAPPEGAVHKQHPGNYLSRRQLWHYL